MRVFLSWSGQRSKDIAQLFRDWLPGILQAIDPYFTPDDIEKGARWTSSIAGELESCGVGLIFLTRENLEAPWIMFEAGALSKKLDASKLCPVLFGIENTDLQGPLTQFQTTVFAKEEVFKLVETLNSVLQDRKLAPPVLEKTFDVWWPQLESAVAKILAEKLPAKKGELRTDRDLIEEVLALTRHLSLAAPRTISTGSQDSALVDLVGSVQELVSQLEQVEMPDGHKLLLQRIRKPLEYLDAMVVKKRRQRLPLPPNYRVVDEDGNAFSIPRTDATRISNSNGTNYVMDKDGKVYVEVRPSTPVVSLSDASRDTPKFSSPGIDSTSKAEGND